MKSKLFLTILIGGIALVAGSALLVYAQIKMVSAVNLERVEERLYAENTQILGWAMQQLQDTTRLEDSAIPASWAEILVVDNASLRIKTSTAAESSGKFLHDHPQLLDQAAPILEAIRASRAQDIATPDYMVAVRPFKDGSTLLGFKPRAWERGLITDQRKLRESLAGRIRLVLMVYLAGGITVVILVALLVALIASRGTQRMARAFEALSLGDFEATPPAGRGRDMQACMETYQRLRTSLQMALERLGSR